MLSRAAAHHLADVHRRVRPATSAQQVVDLLLHHSAGGAEQGEDGVPVEQSRVSMVRSGPAAGKRASAASTNARAQALQQPPALPALSAALHSQPWQGNNTAQDAGGRDRIPQSSCQLALWISTKPTRTEKSMSRGAAAMRLKMASMACGITPRGAPAHNAEV